jgi:hypothetical protein
MNRVMTSSGGSQAAALTNWTPLAKRSVTIWRDADDAGNGYENQVIDILHEVAAASVAAVEVSPDWPEGWDLADPLPEGQSCQDLRQMLECAARRQPEGCSWANPDLRLVGSGRRAAPAFPLALLGEFWSSWVGRRAAAASAPPDCPSCFPSGLGSAKKAPAYIANAPTLGTSN